MDACFALDKVSSKWKCRTHWFAESSDSSPKGFDRLARPQRDLFERVSTLCRQDWQAAVSVCAATPTGDVRHPKQRPTDVIWMSRREREEGRACKHIKGGSARLKRVYYVPKDLRWLAIAIDDGTRGVKPYLRFWISVDIR
jgi:hypothetical protein